MAKIFFLWSLVANLAFCGNKEAFSGVYERAEWGRDEEGVGFSGPGSTAKAAAPFVSYLEKFLKERNIHSVVEI